MAFAFPLHQLWVWILIGTAAILALAGLLRALERRRDLRLHRLVDVKLAPRLIPVSHRAYRRPLVWYPVLALSLLLMALAQPHWGASWQKVQRTSREILILLDTSESMRAQDVAPNRLERAKHKIHTLLANAPADRVGLIAFSGGADLQSPLTVDHGYFKAVLGAMDTDTISLEGSNMEAALSAAIEVFQKDDETRGRSGRSNRAVLLISDGEDASRDALKAAETLSHLSRLYVLGIGTEEGATVALPEWYTRYVGVENTAKAHVSKLDREALSRLALNGGGVYLQNTNDNWDIDQLLEQVAVLASRDASDEIRMQLVNRYQWFLGLGIVFVAAEGAWLALMPHLRRRMDANHTTDRPGDEEYA